MPLKIAAFPKCYIDQIAGDRSMSVFDWIDDGPRTRCRRPGDVRRVFHQPRAVYLDQVAEAIAAAGFAMPMLCCSPDFTNPNPDARKRAVDREVELIRSPVGWGARGPSAVCSRASATRTSMPAARARMGRRLHQPGPAGRPRARHRPGPGKPLQGQLLEISRVRPETWMFFSNWSKAIPERDHFGVQYDPSNAIVAGDDPIALLRAVARPGREYARQRPVRSPTGTTLDDLRQTDGTLGYSPNLRHGVTGNGLNDYPTIFRILADHHYQGWVSIEDGMNGMDEMAESLAFLRRMSQQYFPG